MGLLIQSGFFIHMPYMPYVRHFSVTSWNLIGQRAQHLKFATILAFGNEEVNCKYVYATPKVRYSAFSSMTPWPKMPEGVFFFHTHRPWRTFGGCILVLTETSKKRRFLLLFLKLAVHEKGELAIDYLYDWLQTCSGRSASA